MLELSRVRHFSGVPLYGRLKASSANITLSWGGLSETNARAYYKNSYIVDTKSFGTLAMVTEVKVHPRQDQNFKIHAAHAQT